MDSLPDELNCMIASHLSTTTDCANYRLISKQFARLGAGDLFRYFGFGKGTPASALSRMNDLIASPSHLAKHVKGLDYIEEYIHDDEEHARARGNCRVVEDVAKGFTGAGGKIEVLSVQRVRFEFFESDVDGNGNGNGNGHDRLTAFALACRHVKDLFLGFDHLRRSRIYQFPDDVRAVERNIRDFLGKLDELEVLTVSFDEDDFRGWGPGHLLGNVLPSGKTWGSLRSCELHHFHVDGYDLITFLRKHRETGRLECVHWTNINLKLGVGGGHDQAEIEEKKGEMWRNVFEEIGMMDLKHGDVCEGDSWEQRVGEWVVKREGGGKVVIRTDLGRYLEDTKEGDGGVGDGEATEDGSGEGEDV